MTGSETEAQLDIERRSIKAAYFAGACNILSIFFPSVKFFRHEIFLDQLGMTTVGLVVLLAPLLVVFLGRRLPAITFPYAVLLFTILAGQFLGSADWALFFSNWVWALLGLLSVLFLLFLAAKYLEIVIANAWKRHDGADTDG